MNGIEGTSWCGVWSKIYWFLQSTGCHLNIPIFLENLINYLAVNKGYVGGEGSCEIDAFIGFLKFDH